MENTFESKRTSSFLNRNEVFSRIIMLYDKQCLIFQSFFKNNKRNRKCVYSIHPI